MLFCGELDGIVATSLIPIQVLYPIKCLQIACGRKHVLVLGENNIVMSWGRGYFGHLVMVMIIVIVLQKLLMH